MEEIERPSRPSKIVFCFREFDKDKCECVLNALMRYGFNFRAGFWDAPRFEVDVYENILFINVYNDTGLSQMEIAPRALNEQLWEEIMECLKNK